MAFLETYGSATILLMATGWATTIAVFMFTGIAKRVIKRIKQQWLYKKGNHVNVIMLHNNGVANEHFIKKSDDNSFRFGKGKDRYVVVRKKSILLDGIPTQINIEGIAEPIDVISSDTDEKMATAEIEQLIMNNETKDFVQMLKEYKPYALVLIGVIVVAVGAGLYFNWQIYDSIVQQGAIMAANGGTNLGGGR